VFCRFAPLCPPRRPVFHPDALSGIKSSMHAKSKDNRRVLHPVQVPELDSRQRRKLCGPSFPRQTPGLLVRDRVHGARFRNLLPGTDGQPKPLPAESKEGAAVVLSAMEVYLNPVVSNDCVLSAAEITVLHHPGALTHAADRKSCQLRRQRSMLLAPACRLCTAIPSVPTRHRPCQ